MGGQPYGPGRGQGAGADVGGERRDLRYQRGQAARDVGVGLLGDRVQLHLVKREYRPAANDLPGNLDDRTRPEAIILTCAAEQVLTGSDIDRHRPGRARPDPLYHGVYSPGRRVNELSLDRARSGVSDLENLRSGDRVPPAGAACRG